MSGVGKAIGGVIKGVGKAAGKVVGGLGKVVKNFVTADALKLAAIGAGIYLGGGAMGAWPLPSFLSGQAGATAGIGATLSQTSGIAAGPTMAQQLAAQQAAQAGLAAAGGAPLIQTAMASPMTAAAMSPVVSGSVGQSTLMGAAPNVLPSAAPTTVATGGTAPTMPGVTPPKPPHRFWTHPATYMGAGLLGGYMQSKAHEELLNKRYDHERDLQRERIAARQIRYGGGAGRPSRLYREMLG